MDATAASWVGLIERAEQLGPDPALVGLDDAGLEAEVRDGAARIAAATCRWLEHVAELAVRGVWAEQHARTPGQWLSWAVGVAGGTAREYVRVSLRRSVLANLLLVCAHHHTVIHRHGWTLTAVDAAGRWSFHAPGTDTPTPTRLAAARRLRRNTPDQQPVAPHALQPPWWDGEPYDLSETIRVVTNYLDHLRPPQALAT